MKYKILENQVFSNGKYSLVPIRTEDKYAIMKWRNEQIYHLRQNKPLTETDQDTYFDNVIVKLFDQERPNQILFSYLDNGNCIGYGGLVHINWTDKNAEISFIMDTALEKDFFSFHWKTYLDLIEKVAFKELELHKIFTYAFDLRPRLYVILENSGYEREARLKEHCFFEGKYIDVIIHSKTNGRLYLRNAGMDDLEITYSWANHPHTRQYAFNQEFISLEEHSKWFTGKITDQNCIYKLLISGAEPLGSIRFDLKGDEGLISYLIGPDHIGKGYGKNLLELSILSLEKERTDVSSIKGLVKKENIASVKIFEKLGFDKTELDENVLEFRMKINHAGRKL
ncbi:GNAT family N-acetyltransferase [Shivajiella indica]|uniref:GNAT family N-acetyltransferase n=1 Tax=Shivajiella indica TaxID=872115 RepID=A0ABW5B7I8_9BACT